MLSTANLSTLEDIDDAMRNPDFAGCIKRLAGDYRTTIKPIIDREPLITIPSDELRRYSAESIEAAIEAVGCKVNDVARSILPMVSFRQEFEDAAFVQVTIAELGYPEGCDIVEAIAVGPKFNLECCFSGDGPLIRRMLPKTPEGIQYTVIMEPIRSGDGSNIFTVVNCIHGLGAVLATHGGSGKIHIAPNTELLYRRHQDIATLS